MDITGSEFIEAIVQRLKDEGRMCYDSTIINKLSTLTKKELRMIVDFGDVDSWVRGRNKATDENTD